MHRDEHPIHEILFIFIIGIRSNLFLKFSFFFCGLFLDLIDHYPGLENKVEGKVAREKKSDKNKNLHCLKLKEGKSKNKFATTNILQIPCWDPNIEELPCDQFIHT